MGEKIVNKSFVVSKIPSSDQNQYYNCMFYIRTSAATGDFIQELNDEKFHNCIALYRQISSSDTDPFIQALGVSNPEGAHDQLFLTTGQIKGAVQFGENKNLCENFYCTSDFQYTKPEKLIYLMFHVSSVDFWSLYNLHSKVDLLSGENQKIEIKDLHNVKPDGDGPFAFTHLPFCPVIKSLPLCNVSFQNEIIIDGELKTGTIIEASNIQIKYLKIGNSVFKNLKTNGITKMDLTEGVKFWSGEEDTQVNFDEIYGFQYDVQSVSGTTIYGGVINLIKEKMVEILRQNDQISNLSQPRRYLASASVIVNGKGYVFFGGGYSASNYSNRVDLYVVNENETIDHFDSENNSNKIEPLNEPRRYLTASSVIVDGKGYVFFIGGEKGNKICSTVVDLYIVNENGNIQHGYSRDDYQSSEDLLVLSNGLYPLGQARQYTTASSVSVNGKGYVFVGGGTYYEGGSQKFSNVVDLFIVAKSGSAVVLHHVSTTNDPANRLKSSLCDARTQLTSSSISVNGKGYVFFVGGIYYEGSSQKYGNLVDLYIVNENETIDHYDSKNNEINAPPLAQGRIAFSGTSVVLNRKGYILFAGGNTSLTTYANTVDLYIVNENGSIEHMDSLSEEDNGIKPLDQSRNTLGASSVVVNGKGYIVLGGGQKQLSSGHVDNTDLYIIEKSGVIQHRSNENGGIQSLEEARLNVMSSSVVVNEKGYVFFGGGYTTTFSNKVDLYKIE